MEKSCSLDQLQDQNLALAQWDLQKLLAAGSIADEIVLLHTAFLSPGQNGQVNSQVSQAQKMASFLEEISGGGLSVSVLYDLIASPTTKNAQLLSSPGLSPQTLVENQLANAVYPIAAGGDSADYDKMTAQWNDWAARSSRSCLSARRFCRPAFFCQQPDFSVAAIRDFFYCGGRL